MILTYHPLNTRAQRILLENFKVIADDPATSLIFPQPPMVAFRRDDNLRTSLVHTTEKQAVTLADSYPCQHPRCRTCGHISSKTDILGPKDRLSIKDSLTCLLWSYLLHLLQSLPCHLHRAIKLCNGNKQRKKQEMRLIFRLGTCQPRCLTADFHFI